jgi:hypothetical protein
MSGAPWGTTVSLEIYFRFYCKQNSLALIFPISHENKNERRILILLAKVSGGGRINLLLVKYTVHHTGEKPAEKQTISSV